MDGINNNILAYANNHYDVEGSNKIDTLYSVKDLFKHEVISFYPSCDGVSVKIHKFHGMKYIKRQSYKNENGITHTSKKKLKSIGKTKKEKLLSLESIL